MVTEEEVVWRLESLLTWHLALARRVTAPAEHPYFAMPAPLDDAGLLADDYISTKGFLSKRAHVSTYLIDGTCKTCVYLTGPRLVAAAFTGKGGTLAWRALQYGDAFGRGKELKENELAFYRDVIMVMERVAGKGRRIWE